MIVLRYGEPNDLGVYPDSLDLMYPVWSVDGDVDHDDGVRVHTAPVDQGTYTQRLGSEAEMLTIPLLYVPHRGRTFVHWSEPLETLRSLRLQPVNVAWGRDDLGEWVLRKVRRKIRRFLHRPGTTPGLWPLEVGVRLEFVRDAEEVSVIVGLPETLPDIDEGLGI